MRVVLYTGKGGVGKTTTAAATGVRAAEIRHAARERASRAIDQEQDQEEGQEQDHEPEAGRRVLLLSADPAHSLGDVLDVRLGADPTEVAPLLDAVEVDARVELGRHWGRIRDYLVSLFRYQGIEEVVAEELALLPGAEELTTLVAVEEHAASGVYDLIIVDCAPTDATLRLVTLPDVAKGAIRMLLRLQRAVSAVVTPLAASLVPVPLPDPGVFRDAEHLLYKTLKRSRARLDSDQTHIRMVVTPERMVIEEARRALTELTLFGLRCDLVVMNRFLPPAAGQESFFSEWVRIQGDRLEEVRTQFAPVDVLVAPLQDDEVVGLDRLSKHGRALFEDRDPLESGPMSAGIRFAKDRAGYRIHIPLSGARPDNLDVVVVDDDLMITVGSVRRSLKLPPRIAACALTEARIEPGELVVAFDTAPRHHGKGL
jgi:arsenite-transporting ATPase